MVDIVTATARAHPNIAFIKYWGNRDAGLRLPVNGSISMNLGSLFTQTSLEFSPEFSSDILEINHQTIKDAPLQRVSKFLDLLRSRSGVNQFAKVTSINNFPIGAGIASSASAFAALAMAGSAVLGLPLDEISLSMLARQGSGSACRSIPGGFVEWSLGTSENDSFSTSIAPPDHWDLVDCIAIVESASKAVGSTEGHALAATSPLQPARVQDTPRRLDVCRQAILERDFEAFASIVELDSTLMHAIMMTSAPPLFYWSAASLELMKAIPMMRRAGLPVCFTLDAGPNVHILCPASASSLVETRISSFPGVERIIISGVGGPTRLVSNR